jgi:hypothetical protein
MTSQIGVVLPTLGDRPELIVDCIHSIKSSGATYIVVVSPRDLPGNLVHLVDKVMTDPGLGLAAAINFGFANLPASVEYATWIGDDDLFEVNALSILAEAMRTEPTASFVYGICTYINIHGKIIGVNRVGNLAWRLLEIGPDLIPQPSALFRVRDFHRVGGLNSIYKNSFDFDLFLKLKKVGKPKYIPVNISKFRWHEGSLSVNQRWRAVIEASQVRRSHLSRKINLVSGLWEIPVIFLTYLAGRILNARSR